MADFPRAQSRSIISDLNATTIRGQKVATLPLNPEITDGITFSTPRLMGTIFYSLKDKGIYYCDGVNFYLLATQVDLISLTERVAALEVSLPVGIVGLQTQIDTINTEIGDIQTDIGTINTEIGDIQTDIGTINTSISTINTEISTINTNITTINADLTTIHTDITSLNILVASNFAFLTAQIAATNLQVSKLANSIGLDVSFIWKALPPTLLYEFVWSNTENMVRQLVAGVPTTQSIWGTPGHTGPPPPLIDPPPSGNGWLLAGLYYNPYYDNIYQDTTSGKQLPLPVPTTPDVVMVTEVVNTTVLLKVEVVQLDNPATLGADFDTYIKTPANIADLSLGLDAFITAHPLLGRRQLPYASANMLINYPPSVSTFTSNEYIKASPVGQILDTVIGFVGTLLSFIPVIGGPSGAIFDTLQAGLDIGAAASNIELGTPNPSLPYTNQGGDAANPGSAGFPLKSWVTSQSSITYSVTESMTYVKGGALAPNPPPVPRVTFGPTKNWAIGTITNTYPVGPWVDGVVSLGAGYQVRLRNRQDITPGVAQFPITHFYQDAPLATATGQPGLVGVGAAQVKYGTSSVLPTSGGGFNIIGLWSSLPTYAVSDVVSIGGVSYACVQSNTNISPPNIAYWEPMSNASNLVPSTFKYAQYSTDFTINKNTKDIDGVPVAFDWNAVYINNRLFAVNDGITWRQSDTLINP